MSKTLDLMLISNAQKDELEEWVQTPASGDRWFRLSLLKALDELEWDYLAHSYILMAHQKRKSALRAEVEALENRIRANDILAHRAFFNSDYKPTELSDFKKITADIIKDRATLAEYERFVNLDPKGTLITNKPHEITGEEIVKSKAYTSQKAAQQRTLVSTWVYRMSRQFELARILGQGPMFTMPPPELVEVAIKHYESQAEYLDNLKNGRVLMGDGGREAEEMAQQIVANLELALSLEVEAANV